MLQRAIVSPSLTVPSMRRHRSTSALAFATGHSGILLKRESRSRIGQLTARRHRAGQRSAGPRADGRMNQAEHADSCSSGDRKSPLDPQGVAGRWHGTGQHIGASRLRTGGPPRQAGQVCWAAERICQRCNPEPPPGLGNSSSVSRRSRPDAARVRATSVALQHRRRSWVTVDLASLHDGRL